MMAAFSSSIWKIETVLYHRQTLALLTLAPWASVYCGNDQGARSQFHQLIYVRLFHVNDKKLKSNHTKHFRMKFGEVYVEKICATCKAAVCWQLFAIRFSPKFDEIDHRTSILAETNQQAFHSKLAFRQNNTKFKGMTNFLLFVKNLTYPVKQYLALLYILIWACIIGIQRVAWPWTNLKEIWALGSARNVPKKLWGICALLPLQNVYRTIL
jgi:hypothetical protein